MGTKRLHPRLCCSFLHNQHRLCYRESCGGEEAEGRKILELGCGWGAMLKKIHKQTSHADTLYGYTLSQAQKNFIDEQYGFNVELKDFITLDYEANAFDTIFSIGSIEHVRENELLPLCQNLSKALKPRLSKPTDSNRSIQSASS